MSDPKQGNFLGWAIIEQMGHVTHIGFVESESFGSAVLLRVDTPALPEREYTLTRPEWAALDLSESSREWCSAGSKVKRQGSPAFTKYIGPSSLYAMSPCTEEVAREALESTVQRPIILLEKPSRTAIEAPRSSDVDFYGDGYEQDHEDDEDDSEEDVA